MCLITEQKEPTTVNEDMVVYKIVRLALDINKRTRNGKRVVIPAYFSSSSLQYVEGKLNKTKFSPMVHDICYFDNVVGDYLQDKYDIHGLATLKSVVENATLIGIAAGFHFGLSKKRFENCCIEVNIERFIVPAGSQVYLDATGLGVSNQIIYSPEK